MQRNLLIAVFSLMLSGHSAYATDPIQNGSSASKQSMTLSRIEVLSTKALATVRNLTEDMVPLVKAADEELAREWRSEWPPIQKEIQRQLSAILPWRNSSVETHK